MNAYEWRPGARYRVDANVAGRVCEKLEAEGNLSARSLLDASRPKDAPLHGEFEWSDSVAAEKYREEQARGIIRHLAIKVEERAPVRSFFKLEVNSSSNYTSLETILKKPDLRAALLEQACADMQSFQRKYRELSELSDVFEAMNRAQKVAS